MKKTWYEQLQAVPPKVLRLFARKGPNTNQVLKTADDIAKASGLARSTVAKISLLSSWDTIKFETMVAYISGCGVDPLNLAREKAFLTRPDRRRKFLANANWKQRKMLDRILPKS